MPDNPEGNYSLRVGGFALAEFPVVVLALFLAAISVSAQDTIATRTNDLPLDTPYVLVDLDKLANDTGAQTFPSERVRIHSVPFNIAKKGAANNLFLKPIGWSAAKDESNEYPSYIANYDSR